MGWRVGSNSKDVEKSPAHPLFFSVLQREAQRV